MPPHDSDESKMAPNSEADRGRGEGFGQDEFKDELARGLEKLEATHITQILVLLVPLSVQIQELQATITQTAQTANSAMELGLTNQEASQNSSQHQAEWQREKY